MHRQWIFLLLLALLTACAPQPQAAAPTVPPTSPPTETPSPQPSLTPTTTPAPTTPPAPTPLTCWNDEGVLVEDHVPSQLLPDPIPILVYLPPCYLELPQAQFPVLYLVHGQTFAQNQWVRLGITAAADASIASGEAAPFLIVMPYVADWDQPGEFPFGQALVEEVLPYIEAGFRANPLRAARAVGGVSRGGSWALHLGTRYWDMFSAFGGHSAPVFLDDGAAILSWLNAIPPEDAPRIFLDLANSDQGDIRDSVNWFTNLLDRLDLAYQFHEYPGYHNETYWSSHVEEYLRFYTSEWRP